MLPLEHLLIPSLHDSGLHEAVVRDPLQGTLQYCLECALECLKAHDLLVVRKTHLLLGMDAALERLATCHEDDGSPMPPCEVAAERILPGFLQVVVRPMYDEQEREKVGPGLVAAALRLVSSLRWDEETVAAVYSPLLDAIRAQGIANALHLVDLLSAMLQMACGGGGGGGGDEGPSIPHLSVLLEGDGEEAGEAFLFEPSSPSFAGAFLAFADDLLTECLQGLALASQQRHRGGADDEHKVAELLHLVLLLVHDPRTGQLLLKTGTLARHLNAIRPDALAQLAASSLGANTGDLVKNLLAVALVLLPPPQDQGGSNQRRRQRQANPEEEGGGLLPWHANVAKGLGIKLLISTNLDVALGAATYLLRLLWRPGGAALAEDLLQHGVVEHAVETLRNSTVHNWTTPQHGRLTTRLCRLLLALSKLEPLAFYGAQRFSALLMQELVAVLRRLAEAPYLDEVEEEEEDADDVQQGQGETKGAPAMLLHVIQDALVHSRVLYDEATFEALLSVLATVQETSQLALGTKVLGFASNYVDVAVNNKALFPASAALESFLLAVRQQLALHLAHPSVPTASPHTPLLTIALAAIRGLDILVLRQQQGTVPVLGDVAVHLLGLFTATAYRSGGEEYAVCLFFHLFLSAQAGDHQVAEGVRRLLLEAGVLEVALLHLLHADSSETEEQANVFASLAALLLQEGASMDAGPAWGPSLLRLLAQRDLKPLVQTVPDHTHAAAGEAVHHGVAALLAWLATQDARQLHKWNEVQEDCSCLELVLVLSGCVWKRGGAGAAAVTAGLHRLLASWGQQQHHNQHQQQQQAAYLGRSLTPTAIKLLFDLAGNGGLGLAVEVHAGIEVALHSLSEANADAVHTYCNRFLQQHPAGLLPFFVFGHGPGAQRFLHRWLETKYDEAAFSAALGLYVGHGGGDGDSVLRALLPYLTDTPPAVLLQRLPQGLHVLHLALSCLPHAGGAMAHTLADMLAFLHDVAVPALSAGEPSSPPVEVVLLTTQALRQVPTAGGPPDGMAPVLNLTSRLLLLATTTPSPQQDPTVVAALLVLVNQLVARRQGPFLSQASTILDLAWSLHETAPAVVANALVFGLQLLHHHAPANSPDEGGPPAWRSHPFFTLEFLSTCLSPANHVEQKKAALMLLCRLLSEEGERSDTTLRRRVRLLVQGCLLEEDLVLREAAFAVLLQFWDASLFPPSAWDAFLLRSPSVAASLAMGRSLYAPLFAAACLLHKAPGQDGEDDEGLTESLPTDVLVRNLQELTRQVASGQRDSLPACIPSLLFLLATLHTTRHLSPTHLQALRHALQGSTGKKSSSLSLDDARLVNYEDEAKEGADETKPAGDGQAWYPPHVLALYLHKPTPGTPNHHQEKRWPTHPREVDLKKAVESLRVPITT